MAANGEALKPLGGLAPAHRGVRWSAANLDRAAVLPHELRERIVAYLQACPVVLAWMEYTRDEVDDRFGVAGGSAIASDGTYYWRLDGVEYIREYGVTVPDEAIRHFEDLNWTPPVIDRESYQRIYLALTNHLGGGEVVG